MKSRSIQPLALAAGLLASMTAFASPQGTGNGIIASGPLNHTLVDSAAGTSFNIVASTFDDTGPTSGNWDFNFWDASLVGLLFWVIPTYSTAFVVDEGAVAELQVGDVVGPGSTFSTNQSGSVGPVAAWRAGTDGYVGVRFTCDGRLAHPVPGGICYGYLHLTTTGTAGYPAVLDDAAFDGDGNAITIAAGGAGSDPSATVAPASLSLTATVNASASAILTIDNATGSSPLTYEITSSATTGAVPKPQLIASNDDALAPKLQYLEALRNRPPAMFTPHAIPSSHLGAGSSPRAPDGGFAFAADDGTYEETIGLENGTTTTGAVYANRFTATGALTIDSISVEWPSLGASGSSGVTVGMQPNLVVYYDAAATGDMTNAVRLGSDEIVTIDSLDDFQTYATNFSVPGPGDVYIGFVDEWALVPGGYDGLVEAAALDTSADPSVTYVSGSTDPSVVTDIVNLANNDLNGSGASFLLNGAWLVRATGSGGGGSPCTGPVVDWLTATPAGGAVNGGDAATVTVTATPAAAGLAPGSYTADLCITTNDPTQALIVVPVSLTVTPPMCSGGNDEIFCFGFDGSGSTTGPDVVYGNRTNFLAAIAPGYYENDFHDAHGQSGALQYSDPVSGIAYTVDSSSPLGLWNGNGYIATNGSGDSIVVTFTGTPVTAIGGNFYAVDARILPFPGYEVVITLSDGTTATLTSNGPGDFRGFIAPAPISSIRIDAPGLAGQGDNVWGAMDNLIVGSAND